VYWSRILLRQPWKSPVANYRWLSPSRSPNRTLKFNFFQSKIYQFAYFTVNLIIATCSNSL
jgi:hypothetical protein